MTLNKMIYHCWSCRQLIGKPMDAEMIENILSSEPKPLYPEINACYVGKGVIPYMNRIDIGIVLAHLYAGNDDTFRFFWAEAPNLPEYEHIGSCEI